jgi:HEAT repeat protein
MIASAQTGALSGQGSSNSLPDWAAILDQQAKLQATAIETQQKVADRAIDSVKTSFNNLVSLVQVVGIAVAIIGTLFGAWVALILKDVRFVRTQAAERLNVIERKHEEQDKKLSDADQAVIQLRKRVDECDHILQNSRAMLTQLENVKNVQETIDDALALANIAKLRTQLASGDPSEQLRAIEALAQDKSPRSIPVLIDTLRNPNRSPEILAEALYGLRRRGANVANDSGLVTLIVEVSKHPQKQVRLAAVEAMARIAPHNSSFRTRFVEIRDNDKDNDVRTAAKHATDDVE